MTDKEILDRFMAELNADEATAPLAAIAMPMMVGTPDGLVAVIDKVVDAWRRSRE